MSNSCVSNTTIILHNHLMTFCLQLHCWQYKFIEKWEMIFSSARLDINHPPRPTWVFFHHRYHSHAAVNSQDHSRPHWRHPLLSHICQPGQLCVCAAGVLLLKSGEYSGEIKISFSSSPRLRRIFYWGRSWRRWRRVIPTKSSSGLLLTNLHRVRKDFIYLQQRVWLVST